RTNSYQPRRSPRAHSSAMVKMVRTAIAVPQCSKWMAGLAALQAVAIKGNGALEHHLQRVAGVEAQIAAPAEQRNREAGGAAAGSANAQSLPAACRCPDQRTRSGSGSDSRHVLAFLAFLAQRAFFVVDLLVFGAVQLLDRAGEHDRVSGRENQRREMNQDFRAPLHAPRPLHFADHTLNKGAGRNEDLFILDQGEGRL